MVYTVQNAIPLSTITIIRSGAQLMEPIGQADALGDITWSETYTQGQIVDGQTSTVTLLTNGEAIASVDLTMKKTSAAVFIVNGSKAAIVSYGAQVTFAVSGGEPGLPITLTDSEGTQYAIGFVDNLGAFTYTKQYDNNIGADRTITVYVNSENVILSTVQLEVVNNVGTSRRFRADGSTHAQVTDG